MTKSSLLRFSCLITKRTARFWLRAAPHKCVVRLGAPGTIVSALRNRPIAGSYYRAL